MILVQRNLVIVTGWMFLHNSLQVGFVFQLVVLPHYIPIAHSPGDKVWKRPQFRQELLLDYGLFYCAGRKKFFTRCVQWRVMLWLLSRFQQYF